MEKIKIGIYVFTEKVKKRTTRKNLYFDSEKYNGFKHIILEANAIGDISYVSRETINTVDYVLISITSFMDVFNLLNELTGIDIQSKVIVGGAGVLNIRPYRHLIDYAVFRRGERCIAPIIFNEKLPSNVYSRRDDPEFTGTYELGSLKEFIGNEISVGCQKKCFFCSYGWTNKYVSTVDHGYKSGVSDKEDWFKDFDWQHSVGTGAVTALDGVTEFTRKKVNKYVSDEEITQKMLRAYEIESEKRLSVKIFNIIGYPWEDKNTNVNAIVEAVKLANKNIGRRFILTLSFNHFTPMLMTPLQNEKFNMINFRDKIHQTYFYDCGDFHIYIDPYASSNVYAFENCILERAFEKDTKKIVNILLSKKYRNMSNFEKELVLRKHFSDFLYLSESPVENIKPFYKTNFMSQYHKINP